MYCFIKYIDYKNVYPNETSKSTGNAIENKQLLFNPDCYIKIIQEYIFGKAGIPNKMHDISSNNLASDKFDIATEKGKLLKINDFPPNAIGLNIFADKQTYYIVYWDDDNNIKPMLSEASKEITEFEGHQRRRSSQSKRRSSTNKSNQGSSLISNEIKMTMNQTKN